MFRCITNENKTLIATTCEPESTRKLSRAQKLFCPNCKDQVRYNNGDVRGAYFSHVNLECKYIGSERESPEHESGKKLLYDWLEVNFPKACIEYEVHIPKTGQIVDVYVKHKSGLVWAFEFQHSNISSTAWKERHELYMSADIQDFWVLDKAEFMKFSTAKGTTTGARLKNNLAQTIFEETGLCYFLDLETSELTIDFKFKTKTSYVKIPGGKSVEQSHTYHDPEKHSANLADIKILQFKESKYCVLVSEHLKKYMQPSLSLILDKWNRAEAARISKELNKRTHELIKFAKEKYEDNFANRFKDIIPKNKAELRDDVLTLDNDSFFSKYQPIVDTYNSNLTEYESLKKNTDLVTRYLLTQIDLESLKNVKFLQEQSFQSLIDYLTTKYEEKIVLVQYIYDTHMSVLEFLLTRRPEWIRERLGEINGKLRSYKKTPDVIDYAIRYGALESIDEVDYNIQQINEKIVNYNPSLGISDSDFEDWGF